MARERTMRRPPAEPTVRVARRQFARRQWARRWLAWRAVVVAVVLLALAVGTAWLVFFSSVLAVTTVRVQGVSLLTPAEVRQAAQVPLGEPLARVNLHAITARVKALAPVRSVEVSRAWPHAVSIRVEERHPVAVVEEAGTVRGLDASGVLFRSYASPPRGLPVVHMSAATRPDALAEAAKVVAALPPALAARVEYLDVRTIDTIDLHLRDGRTVLWGSADESGEKAEVVAVLLRHKARTYDVSVPGQPTLRP